ncbi:type II secretion system protein [Myxococcaceae bacterium JPH2]|nr:type II secretion system protein [Myxococcaceae bacterium JPH2]
MRFSPFSAAWRQRSRRGLTLIEISIALAIAAVLFAAVAIGIGALTGAKAKSSAVEMAGVIRSLYDSAALSGKTCRLVFEIPDPKTEEATRYHAECAGSGVTTSRDRDAALRDDAKARTERARDHGSGRDERRNYTRSDNSTPSAQELMAQEKERVEETTKFSSFTAEEVGPRELPAGVSVSVWTRQQHTAVESGVAYLYFFPQGYTEKAMVYLRQGENVWTLDVSPLTGKVNIVAEALEVPRS